MSARVKPLNVARAIAPTVLGRRNWLQRIGLFGARGSNVSLLTWAEDGISEDMSFAGGHWKRVAYAQERPLILVTSRHPRRQTPFEVFNRSIVAFDGLDTGICREINVLKMGGANYC